MVVFTYSIDYWFPSQLVNVKNIMGLITEIIFMIWLIFALLTANRRCMKLILQSFEFWFKLLYLSQFIIALLIYWYVLLDPDVGSTEYYLELVKVSFYYLMFIPLIVVLTSFDAFHVSLSMKTTFAAICATMASFQLILYTFYYDPASVELFGYEISVTSMITGSSQILSIFFWKQAILSVVKRNRCILIKYSPYIKWENDTEQCPSMHVQMTSTSYQPDSDRNKMPVDEKNVLEIELAMETKPEDSSDDSENVFL